MAGILPGIMMATLFILYIYIRCKLQPELGPALPKEESQISKAEKYEPMHKRSMDNLLQCEMRATIQTLKDRNLPLRLFIIDLNDQKQIGSLMIDTSIKNILLNYKKVLMEN